ncbi:hypothetical protein Bhyg_03595 [Pseudolycoriella hygida]|uniref:Uncharacterized protein n=1 Tax=Pseudolycoriella hygida TaxID=35572 RepID=A0A9Q0S7M6_9DIPT|nr:hypothetical protein Bhyg_03595 [Pseudolycoriella hygida]
MQKLYLLIVAFCCVQLCYGAAISNEDNDTTLGMTDEDINTMCNQLSNLPESTTGFADFFVTFFWLGNNRLSKEQWTDLFNKTDDPAEIEREIRAKLPAKEAEEVLKIVRKFSTAKDVMQGVTELWTFGITGLVARSAEDYESKIIERLEEREKNDGGK